MANPKDNVEPTPQIEDNPSPTISGEQGGQSFEEAGDKSVDFSAILSNPDFEAFLDKKIQSKQDSRLGKYGTRLDDLEGAVSKYEALKGSGLSSEQAMDKMRGDQDLADIKAQLEALGGAPSESSAGTGEKPWTERQASILAESGIQKDDRRLSDLLRSNTFANHAEYLKVLEAKSFEWRQADAKKPQPSSSTVAPTAPSVPVGSGEYTLEKYKTDMLAAWGKKDELARIKAAAIADGVDVDNIGFV